MSEPTLPDNRTKALPHEHADVSANVPPRELVLDLIQSTRNTWTLCKAGKLPIDYAADAKELWNLFDERIGAPPDIGEVKDEQQARMALRLMEDALTPTAADSDSGGGLKPDSMATAEPDTGSGKARTVQPLPPSKPNVKSDVSLDARALAVFIESPAWTKKRIAEHLGTNEKCLAPKRCPKLAAAIAAHESPLDPGQRRLRGSKDAEGNLEAWEDE